MPMGQHPVALVDDMVCLRRLEGVASCRVRRLLVCNAVSRFRPYKVIVRYICTFSVIDALYCFS
jgi:hypothetical protein